MRQSTYNLTLKFLLVYINVSNSIVHSDAKDNVLAEPESDILGRFKEVCDPTACRYRRDNFTVKNENLKTILEEK